jgi:ribose transport system permease protein
MALVSVIFMLTIGQIGPWAYLLVILVGTASGFINGVIVSKLRIPSFIATLGTQGILLSFVGAHHHVHRGK